MILDGVKKFQITLNPESVSSNSSKAQMLKLDLSSNRMALNDLHQECDMNAVKIERPIQDTDLESLIKNFKNSLLLEPKKACLNLLPQLLAWLNKTIEFYRKEGRETPSLEEKFKMENNEEESLDEDFSVLFEFDSNREFEKAELARLGDIELDGRQRPIQEYITVKKSGDLLKVELAYDPYHDISRSAA